MLTLKALFEDKMSDATFKQCFEEECHVCAYTLRIFEALEDRGIPLGRLAAELEINKQDLLDLRDADYCNPALVIRICRYLNQAPPPACPRLKHE